MKEQPDLSRRMKDIQFRSDLLHRVGVRQSSSWSFLVTEIQIDGSIPSKHTIIYNCHTAFHPVIFPPMPQHIIKQSVIYMCHLYIPDLFQITILSDPPDRSCTITLRGHDRQGYSGIWCNGKFRYQ